MHKEKVCTVIFCNNAKRQEMHWWCFNQFFLWSINTTILENPLGSTFLFNGHLCWPHISSILGSHPSYFIFYDNKTWHFLKCKYFLRVSLYFCLCPYYSYLRLPLPWFVFLCPYLSWAIYCTYVCPFFCSYISMSACSCLCYCPYLCLSLFLHLLDANCPYPCLSLC